MNQTQEQRAWNEMIDLVKKYESDDERIVSLVKGIHAQKENIRFFVYDIKESKWYILNPLLDETLRLSNEYYEYKKDSRTRKPCIMLTEENYNNRFLWDENQWILRMENLSIIR